MRFSTHVLAVVITIFYSHPGTTVCELQPAAASTSQVSEVKSTAQTILAIVRSPNYLHASSPVAVSSTKQAQFEAALKKTTSDHTLTESKLREGKHAADAVKIQDVLVRLVHNTSHIEQLHARVLGELVGEIAVKARAHFDGQAENLTSLSGLGNSLKDLNTDMENIIVPLGTALARLLVERLSKLPPPLVHQEMENGIRAVIDQQHLLNESAHFAYILANQIHLQELAVCGHLILNGLIQPYDYLEAVGCGVGEVLAIMNDDDKRVTVEMVLPMLEVHIVARIRVALILAEVPHNQSLDDGIAMLANEIANYTAGDIVRLMSRSKEQDVARQEMRMASAHYAKALWNLRILNLGSLVVLRTPPSLITFTFEDDLASYVPQTWLRFDYVDLEPSLKLYNSRNSAPQVERKPSV